MAMRYKRFGSKLVIRIDKGEEIIDTLLKVCGTCGINLGSVSGIGSAGRATIGLFDTAAKNYHSKELVGEYEITSLSGTVTTMEGKPYLHVHATLSDASYAAFGGHLNAALVSGTCEVIIDIMDGGVDRVFSEEVGLNLFNLH
jgi:predicted DNA-binding protein with PD1-like motif